MSDTGRLSLIVAGAGLAFGALLHLVALVGGPAWIGFVGAPPAIVDSARAGTWLAPVTTLGIGAILAVGAGYAFAGAGWLRRLPFMIWVLRIVAFVLILRGLMVVPMAARANFAAAFDAFHVAASAFVLAIGCLLAIGVRGLRPAS